MRKCVKIASNTEFYFLHIGLIWFFSEETGITNELVMKFAFNTTSIFWDSPFSWQIIILLLTFLALKLCLCVH